MPALSSSTESSEDHLSISITVTCPECGAKLKLKHRSVLGKERPCPKCQIPFVLVEDSHGDSYDVDLDARGVDSRPSSKQPVLKRGASRQSPAKKRGGPAIDVQNKPLLVGLGVGGLVAAGMLLAWLIMPRGAGPAPTGLTL